MIGTILFIIENPCLYNTIIKYKYVDIKIEISILIEYKYVHRKIDISILIENLQSFTFTTTS